LHHPECIKQRGTLVVASPMGIPEKFTLVVPSDGLHFPCRVVWRKEHRIGVVFAMLISNRQMR
jgi:hypothetical protein